MSSSIVKMGWLIKEGGVVKSWKKRWFILDGETGLLTYYSTKKDKPDVNKQNKTSKQTRAHTHIYFIL